MDFIEFQASVGVDEMETQIQIPSPYIEAKFGGAILRASGEGFGSSELSSQAA